MMWVVECAECDVMCCFFCLVGRRFSMRQKYKFIKILMLNLLVTKKYHTHRHF